ncbi:MAG: hypothetical protein ABIT38_19745, partial [Gemmatimonadaceae bacterium]
MHALLACAALLQLPITREARAQSAASSAAPYDVVITNGRIVDGTGNAWYRGDVGIRGDRIARIALPGALAKAPAKSRVDAHDHIVSPGFIDIQA